MPMVPVDQLKSLGYRVEIEEIGEVPDSYWDHLHKIDLEDNFKTKRYVSQLSYNYRLQMKSNGYFPTVEIHILKDEGKKYPRIAGTIKLTQADRDVWHTYYSRADHGLGPTLYDIAIKYVSYRNGRLISHSTAKERYPWMPYSQGENTPDSQRVWDKYKEREDMVGDASSGIKTKEPQVEDPYDTYKEIA